MAHEMALAVLLLIGTLHVSHVASLALGAQCYEDTDCSTVATAVTNSYCARTYSSCPWGVCACSSGYALVGTGCNAEVANAGACTDDAECVKDLVLGTMTCDTGVSGNCICASSGTYDTTYKICHASGKLALGKAGCLLDADCDPVTNAECATSGSCACPSGYITDTTAQTCTKPYAGEACTATVGCQVRAQIPAGGGDTSEQVPTCTSNICSCTAATETEITINSMKRCVTTKATRYNEGIECTHLNECETYLCATCAGWDADYCVGTSRGAALKTASGVLLATLVLVGSVFY